jgi:hypothetical protein
MPPLRRPPLRRARLTLLVAALALASCTLVSTTVTPAVASTVVFADGFESGSTAAWTSVSRVAPVGSPVASGAWAGRINATRTSGQVTRALGSSLTDVAVTAKFRVAWRYGTVTLLRLRRADKTPVISLRMSSTGGLSTLNHITGATTVSSATIPLAAWTTLTLRGATGSGGLVRVVMDGVRVADLSGPATLGMMGIGRVQVGDSGTPRVDMTIDAVTIEDVDGSADVAAPSRPGSPKGVAVTPTRVDLTWARSSDDVAVAGYRVLRDGAYLGETTGTSTVFRVIDAEPGVSASYAIRAVDPTGNVSAASSSVSVTPPAAPATGTVLATDTFERPNGPGLGTADLGGAWSTDSKGSWSIEDGAARVSSGPPCDKTVAWLTLTVSDRFQVASDITLSPTLNRANVGLLVSGAGPNDHLWAKLEVSPGHPDGLVTIGKMDPILGTVSLLSPMHDVGMVNGDTYRTTVTVDGGSVTVLVTGLTDPSFAPASVSYDLTPAERSTYGGNLQAGLRLRVCGDEDDLGSRWRSFRVTAL